MLWQPWKLFDHVNGQDGIWRTLAVIPVMPVMQPEDDLGRIRTQGLAIPPSADEGVPVHVGQLEVWDIGGPAPIVHVP